MSDWDELSPADDSIVSQYPANERDARSAAKTNFGVDHREENDANVGKHEIVKLLPQTTPSGVAGEGHLYTKDIGGGVIELFSQDAAGNETQLTAGGVLKPFPTGTRVFFQQSAAPTGFTKVTDSSFNNTAVRIVTGTVGSRTTQSPFTTVFNKTATDGHALSISEIQHKHETPSAQNAFPVVIEAGWPHGSSGANRAFRNTNAVDPQTLQTLLSGPARNNTSSPHSHPMDIRVNYHDTIIGVQD